MKKAKNQVKHKTMREVVSDLEKQGHSVTYYVRKDGGILIKTIDGQRFTGATGNLYARAMVGETLSTKRANQLSQITWSGKRAKSQISNKYKKIKDKLKQVQRKWREAFGVNPPVGKKTSKKVKWQIENKGVEETERLLNEAERYAKGQAYTKNIGYLVDRILDYAEKFKIKNDGKPSDVQLKLINLADEIMDNKDKIMEKKILVAYEALYDLDHGIPPEDVINNVRGILGLKK